MQAHEPTPSQIIHRSFLRRRVRLQFKCRLLCFVSHTVDSASDSDRGAHILFPAALPTRENCFVFEKQLLGGETTEISEFRPEISVVFKLTF